MSRENCKLKSRNQISISKAWKSSFEFLLLTWHFEHPPPPPLAPLPYQFGRLGSLVQQIWRPSPKEEEKLWEITPTVWWRDLITYLDLISYLDSRRHEPPCLFPTCRFPELTRKFADCLDDHGWVQLITNPTRGKNVVDLFITFNDSLIIKTQVIPGISDHDAVFVEGNIKATITKQNAGWFPCIEKHTGMALKNTCLNM